MNIAVNFDDDMDEQYLLFLFFIVEDKCVFVFVCIILYIYLYLYLMTYLLFLFFMG